MDRIVQNLRDAILDIRKKDPSFEINEDKFLTYVSTHPLTHIVSPNCEDELNCPLKFLVFLPKKQGDYEVRRVHPVPTVKKKLFSTEFRQLKLSPEERKFLINKNNQIAQMPLLQCIPAYTQDMCDLCIFRKSQRPISNPCTKALAHKQEAWTVCKVEDVENPEDTVVSVSPGEWIYSDDTPGKLIEKCGEQEKVYELPYTGRITLRDDCQYQTFDNVITTEEIQGDRLIISDVSDKISLDLSKEDNIVLKHIKQNIRVYVLTLSSIIAVLILSWALYCYVKPRRLIRRLRRRRNQRQSDPIPAAPLIPLVQNLLALRSNRPNEPIIL